MAIKTRATWFLSCLGLVCVCLSVVLFFTTRAFAACSASVDCPGGGSVSCNCPGGGTCNSNPEAGTVTCVCDGQNPSPGKCGELEFPD